MLDLPFWEWAYKVGGPLLISLFLMVYGSRTIIKWTGTHLILVLRDRILLHFDNLDGALAKFAENDTRHAENEAQQVLIMQKLTRDVTELKSAMYEVQCPVLQKIIENNNNANRASALGDGRAPRN